MEVMALTLLSADVNIEGPPLPAEFWKPARSFADGLAQFRSEVLSLPASRREDLILGRTLKDIFPTVAEILIQNGVELSEFEELGRAGWEAFVERMPTRQVEMQLLRQWVANPGLEATPSTLNDWTYLGLASAYADIVVTEKLFADLVSRGRFRTNARVITKLEDLSGLLAELHAG